MSGTETERAPRGELSAAISNLVVKLTSDYTGRGPTRARTQISDEVVTVILRDTMTRGERCLVRDGKAEIVRSTRLAFQMTMREDLIAGIEGILGRKVLAFMSANHLEPDIAAELFVLDGAAAASEN